MSLLIKKKIQIVVRTQGWILEAIANQWYREFRKSCNVDYVLGDPKLGADLYLHFFFGDCKIVKNAINIVYVTHLSSIVSSLIILKQYCEGCYFLTMSEETKTMVQKICNDRNCVLSHIPDSLHFAKKDRTKKMVFGYFNKRHEDGRKNDSLLISIADIVSKSDNSSLLIYGSGWEKLFNNNEKNIVIDNSVFDKEVYLKHLNNCDYVMYLSYDEGAISILDATCLSIPVIATSVGFHKELNFAKGSMLFNKSEDILSTVSKLVIANDIQERSEMNINATTKKILKLDSFSKKQIGIINIIAIFRIRYVYSFSTNVFVTFKEALNIFNKSFFRLKN